jgi:hypothetical protein
MGIGERGRRGMATSRLWALEGFVRDTQAVAPTVLTKNFERQIYMQSFGYLGWVS